MVTAQPTNPTVLGDGGIGEQETQVHKKTISAQSSTQASEMYDRAASEVIKICRVQK